MLTEKKREATHLSSGGEKDGTTIELSTHYYGSEWVWKFYHLCSISVFKIWIIIIVYEPTESVIQRIQ
jgi:hypothetical protein